VSSLLKRDISLRGDLSNPDLKVEGRQFFIFNTSDDLVFGVDFSNILPVGSHIGYFHHLSYFAQNLATKCVAGLRLIVSDEELDREDLQLKRFTILDSGDASIHGKEILVALPSDHNCFVNFESLGENVHV